MACRFLPSIILIRWETNPIYLGLWSRLIIVRARPKHTVLVAVVPVLAIKDGRELNYAQVLLAVPVIWEI